MNKADNSSLSSFGEREYWDINGNVNTADINKITTINVIEFKAFRDFLIKNINNM